ncbi:MAG: hypothetical protein RBT65_16640, partial [Methanolobus sp.]|nr:hypothetical protein [Methanolobus sp.]
MNFTIVINKNLKHFDKYTKICDVNLKYDNKHNLQSNFQISYSPSGFQLFVGDVFNVPVESIFKMKWDTNLKVLSDVIGEYIL